MEKGTFIVFEGGDGAGHGTQAEILARELQRLGYDVVHTHEPGGTPMAEILRDMLLSINLPEQLVPAAEALAYSLSRAQHVGAKIKPALESGKVVVCERYYLSTYAYQHYGREISLADLRSVTQVAIQGIEPDLQIILDVPPEVGLKRKGKNLDRIEGAGLEFHQRVREGYRKLAFSNPGNCILVDAEKSIEVVAKQVLGLALIALKKRTPVAQRA